MISLFFFSWFVPATFYYYLWIENLAKIAFVEVITKLIDNSFKLEYDLKFSKNFHLLLARFFFHTNFIVIAVIVL